jgi:hypothetical protein
MKPVGWWNEKRRINWLDAVLETKEDGWDTPLYTAPRELSEGEILQIAKENTFEFGEIPPVQFARAILKKASEK